MIHKCYANSRPQRAEVVGLPGDNGYFWTVQYGGSLLLAAFAFCPWCGILLDTTTAPTPVRAVTLIEAVREVSSPCEIGEEEVVE